MTAKAAPTPETLRPKDDSNKENVCLLPSDNRQKGEFTGDVPANTVEPRPKDSLRCSDHPLAERTQVGHEETSFPCPVQRGCSAGVSPLPTLSVKLVSMRSFMLKTTF